MCLFLILLNSLYICRLIIWPFEGNEPRDRRSTAVHASLLRCQRHHVSLLRNAAEAVWKVDIKYKGHYKQMYMLEENKTWKNK